jgi:hypothetical protein
MSGIFFWPATGIIVAIGAIQHAWSRATGRALRHRGGGR